METSLLICSANQWTGFYMRGTSVMKELMIVKVNLLNFRTKQRRAKALIDFERHEDDELGFRKHDLITVRWFSLFPFSNIFIICRFSLQCLVAAKKVWPFNGNQHLMGNLICIPICLFNITVLVQFFSLLDVAVLNDF